MHCLSMITKIQKGSLVQLYVFVELIPLTPMTTTRTTSCNTNIMTTIPILTKNITNTSATDVTIIITTAIKGSGKAFTNQSMKFYYQN